MSYLPVLDSRGVDRALSVDGGRPLFLQVKAHEHARRDGRLTFAIPRSAIGTYPRWLVAMVAGTPDSLTGAFLVPGADLLRLGEHGHLTDGRECVRATLSPTSPTWSRYWSAPAEIGARLLAAAAPVAGGPAAPFETAERQQEEGAYFEAVVTAELLGGSDRLVLYRPAVDVAGTDLLAQLAGSGSCAFLQVKGTSRQDVPDHAHFQIRRRTFEPDPGHLYVFGYRPPGGDMTVAWLVDAPALQEGTSPRDAAHISFEPRIAGADPRWGAHRLPPGGLAEALIQHLRSGHHRRRRAP
ncbi:MAG: hypothetical protein ACREPA_08835 [Candidatus Dormibacteraceae bacterium]